MKISTLLAGALLSSSALAQTSAPPEPCPCAPFESSANYYALVISYNFVGGPGPWLAWSCYAQKIPAGSTTAPAPKRCAMAALWRDVTWSKLGDRAETVRKAKDPLAAFQASWRRHVDRPLSDPYLAPVVDAMREDIKHGGR